MIARKTYASGGGIHIKPENRGKFTSWAKSHGMSVQDAARHVLANKDKYAPAIIKRANFAKNAAGWKKANGGEIGNDPDSYRPLNMQDVGRLRRTGSLPGWEEMVNEDGTTPDVDISSLTPLDVNTNIPLQPSKRNGLLSVLYTPDRMKTSEYINALRMQTKNTKRYNSHVDVLNAMKNKYNQGLG